ncbi:hypothetical protein [Aulosira sp. FACHB-615]|uniref:hypothetical protein n=1 Tax=Aulosira sp. FACHB-615 TaxID=2692777 RepID=UPI0016832FC2|nr:hypothetical protein [Aulosira sp. FACHB-615]MBD2489016.1 hypothetical protein [Aulosira sp. FACHB-615]
MTSPPPDSKIGKGYSYLFAIVVTGLIVFQSINIEFKTDKSGDYHLSVASKDLNVQLFTAGVGIIATILGLPTDAIALAVGSLLSGKGRK